MNQDGALIDQRVEALLDEMTLREKIGQMTQVSRSHITPEEVAEHAIGSVLNGGSDNPEPNRPAAWAAMARSFEEAALASRLGVPLLYGVDAVHGHSNVRGATVFPHNVGLGAAGDPDLVEVVGRVTAREMLATNIHWNFAPCVAVPQDVRWGRTYEGFGDDPELVAELSAASVCGLQLDNGREALACAKHFVGDGGTRWGSAEGPTWLDWWTDWGETWQIDQGETDVDEETLRAVHLRPYAAAIAAGVRSIMVSYSSWGGVKMHAHYHLLTNVLKGEMGFDGFLVSDWMAIDQIDPDYGTCVVTAINAGLDMVMVPFDYMRFIDTSEAAVRSGEVPVSRVEDAARRILSVKAAIGLFNKPFGNESQLEEVGSAEHRAVARRAVRRSAVLLKNEGALPVPRNVPRLLVAGRAADDVGLQSGGWTVDWQGRAGNITPGTTLLAAMRHEAGPATEITYAPDGRFPDQEEPADIGIVVLAEEPYAEGLGDRADLTLPADDVTLLERVRARCRKMVVLLYSGRPLVVTEQLPQWDAFVAAWLPGSEAGGIVDVLFGDYPFGGRTPYAWPRSMRSFEEDVDEAPLFPRGAGL